MLVGGALASGVLVGCGPPPEVAPTPDAPLPTPETPVSPGTAPPSAAGRPTDPPPTSVDDAVDCAGEPDGSHVLAVLQDAGLWGDTGEAGPEFSEGPLCADGWQFSVITVPERDPLQVITSGDTDELALVTAGTDVCTIEVRVHAPPGIRRVAGCVG